jgi:hypothetical protein
MKLGILTLAAFVTLTAGAMTTANAEFGVGPNGVYVGPERYHHYYRDYDRDYDPGYYGNCRAVITHRTNRFGEDLTIRRRICDGP